MEDNVNIVGLQAQLQADFLGFQLNYFSKQENTGLLRWQPVEASIKHCEKLLVADCRFWILPGRGTAVPKPHTPPVKWAGHIFRDYELALIDRPALSLPDNIGNLVPEYGDNPCLKRRLRPEAGRILDGASQCLLYGVFRLIIITQLQ